MIDTNVFISAAVLSSPRMLQLIEEISENHTVVLSTYIVDELKRVTREKFPDRVDTVERFLHELPFELTYTPEKIDKSKYPEIRDIKDLPVLVSALKEDVDVLLSGDIDFSPLDIERPEILSPRAFIELYGNRVRGYQLIE